jgi:hypothetical protein
VIADWELRELAHKQVHDADLPPDADKIIEIEKAYARLTRQQWDHILATARKNLLGVDEEHAIKFGQLVGIVSRESNEGASKVKVAIGHLVDNREAIYKFGYGVWATDSIEVPATNTAYIVGRKQG